MTKKQPALQVEVVPATDLVPYARNTRKHPPEQIASLRSSIREFGFVNPILVDADLSIIAGHARLKAATEEGMTEVPVIRLGHLTDAQRRAYVIADNRLAELAEWDIELLRVEVADIVSDGIDLDSIGFDEESLRDLLGDDPMFPGDGGSGPEDDPAPPPPENPTTQPGDLYIMGVHRLLCGDATNAESVARLLGGEKPHLMVTDPPYGVEYDPSWRNEAGVSSTTRPGKVANDDRADWREAWALFPGDVAYVWHAAIHAKTVTESLEATGFAIRSQIIWAKSRFVLGRGDYHWQHEPCLYAVRKGGTGHWQGARDQATVWSIGQAEDAENEATVHGTQKPVECMRRPIVNNSEFGATIYEPFGGSGSTLIAAETVGRACYCMELDPRYCDVIVARWEKFTGKKAKRILASDVSAPPPSAAGSVGGKKKRGG